MLTLKFTVSSFADTPTNCKESSPPSQTSTQQLPNNVSCESGTNGVTPAINSLPTAAQKPNNNNKGENGVATRRGKSNSESKAQAARNKHKNSQNKEKHSNTRTTSRSESNSNITQSNSGTQPQVNGQKEIRNYTAESTSSEVVQKSSGGRLKVEQPQQQTVPSAKGSKLVRQLQDLNDINGVVQNGEHSNSESESEPQREGSTPASTISSLDDSNANNQAERLGDSCEEIGSAAILGEFLRIAVLLLAYLTYYRWSNSNTV